MNSFYSLSLCLLMTLATLSMSSLASAKNKLVVFDNDTTELVVDLVKVDKSSRRMYLYSNDTLVKQYHIALGPQPKGHKEQEGDGRTPEGSYTLDYKKENSAFYRSMHIDYPNQQDVANAKAKNIDPGGFIMIHGQKSLNTKQALIMQKFNWTDGCIAITNAEMDEFMNLVDTGTKIQIQW